MAQWCSKNRQAGHIAYIFADGSKPVRITGDDGSIAPSCSYRKLHPGVFTSDGVFSYHEQSN